MAAHHISLSLCLCLAPLVVMATSTQHGQLLDVPQPSKAGLAWPNAGSVDISQYRMTGKVSWYYSWSPSPFDTDLEFVPMLWGQDQIGSWQSTINQTIQQRAVHAALTFNEPELPSQSNLTAQQGADLWKQYIQPLKTEGLRLGSPAPSSAPSGKTWLQEWLQACAGGCSVDFIALHWYGVDADAFTAYLADFHATFNLPIWVTEWACQNYVDSSKQCSQDGVSRFMNVTQSFMDSTSYVERYAWFGAMENLQGVNPDNALMTPDGKINALGEQYIGASGSNTSTTTLPNAAHPLKRGLYWWAPALILATIAAA
ncbi:glycoside hydrolase [Gloeopeniophorella convolvens]|nr:glycoside hydrolase [Gloeopeniophorella convolvens]